MAPTPAEDVLIEYLKPNPWQPREVIDQSTLQSLSYSIKEYGFSGYLEARHDPNYPEQYQLVFGHRRARAAQLAGLRALPVVVREYTDKQMAELALLENHTQEQLSYLDEGKAFRRLMDEHGYSIRQLADIFHISRGYITNRLAVAALPEGSPLYEAAKGNQVDLTTIQTLRSMAQDLPEEEILGFLERAKAGEIKADDLKAVRQWYRTSMPQERDILEDGTVRSTITLSLADQERARQEARDLERQRGLERYEAVLAQERARPEEEEFVGDPIPVYAESQNWSRIAPRTTSPREYAEQALMQLRANVGSLQIKLRHADLGQLRPRDCEEWNACCREMITLLGQQLNECPLKVAVTVGQQLQETPLQAEAREELQRMKERATLLIEQAALIS